ncbi:MAG: two-component sensor histidine kinase [Anaerolineae bacterium]|nr:HAMP domain-containing protein [Anaerolineales bacterium]MCQ3973938.1 two-component sensor histidine kinase [Anaerolineae bacterium]
MNIRLRLTLWYTIILVLILVVFGAAVYIGLSRSLIATLDNHLQREAGQLIGGINFETEDEHEDDEEDEQEHRNPQLSLRYRPEEGVLWRVLDDRGRPLIDSGYLDGVAINPNLITSDYARFEYTTLTSGIPLRLYSVPFVIEGRGAGIVQVGESYAHIQEVELRLIWLLGLGVPFTLLASSAGGWFLAGRALNPIDRITRAAQQISADDLHQRLDLKLPNDEVGRLAVTFDQMLARLEDAFERQKRFIADASHELRTPLTILKGDVEVALHRPRAAAEYRETLEMVNQTADRLTSLVEELFLLARADNQQYPLQLESFDLSELLKQQVAALSPRAASHNISLSLNAPDTLLMVADPAKLTRLFLNLLDNALKYSNPGDTVSVTVVTHNGQARIAITDTGPGIAPEHLPHLFERFYRVDKARSRQAAANDKGGTGLGLAIADWLVKAHGGCIEVASQVGQGSTFTVWLPLKPPAAGKNSR